MIMAALFIIVVDVIVNLGPLDVYIGDNEYHHIYKAFSTKFFS